MNGFWKKAEKAVRTGFRARPIRPVSYRETRASRANALNYVMRVGQAIWGDRTYQLFSEKGFEENVIAHRCIRLKAESIATLPWYISVDNKPAENHPALRLLYNPNALETSIEFIERIAGFLDIAGDAYLEFAGDANRPELYALRPDRMKMTPNEMGMPALWEYDVGGQKQPFIITYGDGRQQPIAHIRLFNPLDDSYGLSPMAAAWRSIETYNSASEYQKALLDNQARPCGALRVGGKDGAESLTEEQFERLKAQFEEEHVGSENSGRPLVLEGGLDWVPMGLNMEELDFINSKREMAREIALSLGCPPMLLGLPGDNSYSNYAEANRAFFRQTVLPMADRIRWAYSKFLLPTFGPFELAYDIDEISGLETEREARWRRVAGADWLSVNEKRAATGYGPAPAGFASGGDTADDRGSRGPDQADRTPRDIGLKDAPAVSPAAAGE